MFNKAMLDGTNSPDVKLPTPVAPPTETPTPTPVKTGIESPPRSPTVYGGIPSESDSAELKQVFDKPVKLEHTTQPGIFVGGRELSNVPASPTPETPPKVPAKNGILTTIRRRLGH